MKAVRKFTCRTATIPFPPPEKPHTHGSSLFSLFNYGPKMLRAGVRWVVGLRELVQWVVGRCSMHLKMLQVCQLICRPTRSSLQPANTDRDRQTHTYVYTGNCRDSVNKINKNVKQLKAAQQNTTEYPT